MILVPRATADDALGAVQGTPTLTPTPENTPDSHANIPDPDGLPAMPDIASLAIEQGRMTVRLSEGTAYIGWEIDPEADYYLLCVLDPLNTLLQMDILWPDIDTWEIADYQGSRLLLLRYQDMGTKDGQDDVLTGAYVCDTPGAVPSPTPALTPSASLAATPELSASATRKPSSSASHTPAPTAAPNKYYIIVDKADHAFAIFTYDANGEYTQKVATFPCALGRSSRETPTGSFTIGSKGSWKTWSDGTYSPFYTRYTSGLYFHGPIYTAMSGDALIPSSYEAIGTNASAGCMRTTVAGARWVYYNCPKGTVVEVVSSSDLVSYPGKPAIDPNYPTWDPTDPNKPGGTPEATPTPTPTPDVAPTPAAETPAPTLAETLTATPDTPTASPESSGSASSTASESAT